MKITNAFTRQVGQLENTDDPATPILFRSIHPAQDQDLLSSIRHDVGLAPGLALLYDDEHVLIYDQEEVNLLPGEHQNFYRAASSISTWLGVAWELCVNTDNPDSPIEVLSSGCQEHIERLATALNDSIQPSTSVLVPLRSVVHEVDPNGSLYAVTCRLADDDDDSVYHVRCADEGTAQEVAIRNLYEEAGSSPDPTAEGHRQHYIITSQLVATPVASTI